MNDKVKILTPAESKVLSNDPREQQMLRNLNLMVPRIERVGKRWGFDPCRALFRLKSDEQVLDDLVYPLGVPVSRPAWWYGKAAQQQRSQGYGGHVFEFATISDPAEVVLGSTNDLTMHLHVIIHAWMGHVYLFTRNRWHDESNQKNVLQQMAQDRSFVYSLINDYEWGWERYEYYADAAHALEMHSGPFPSIKDAQTDEEHRQELKLKLKELESAWVLAKTDADKQVIEDDIKDTARLLTCHPIKPTSDLLGFLADPENTKHLPEEARRIIEMTRTENRYGSQLIGRTKILHEGVSHWVDRRMPHDPELDFIRLGMDVMIDTAIYDTMHDAWPSSWYSDPYALGEAIIEYVHDTHSKKIGKEEVTYFRLKRLTDDDIATGEYPDNVVGDIIETDEEVTIEVDKWDREYFFEVCRTFDDHRLFMHFLDKPFFERLHKKSLGWVKKMIMLINGRLKKHGWNRDYVFEGDRFPMSLEQMFEVVSTWMNQVQMANGWLGMWMGSPKFPVSEVMLYQMMQIIQTVAAYDEDKDEFKRSMMLRTGLQALPNIKIVDTGRENNAQMWTLRHEYDSDFGPLKESHARMTLQHFWRLCGDKVRLITMEILTDSFGRPWGPPRPYEYSTDNGETIKEKWL